VNTRLSIFPSVRFSTNAALGFVVDHLSCNRAVILEMNAVPIGETASRIKQ
jgi:hypothetical protein